LPLKKYFAAEKKIQKNFTEQMNEVKEKFFHD
jgi:hypothetical protein